MTLQTVAQLRRQFPALQQQRGGRIPIFLDGPAGTQVPKQTIDAIVNYLSTCSANHGGDFSTSEESDRILHKAHEGMAHFLNAESADEIVFGPNMTTLTFHLSRAIGRTLHSGDEIVVTRLDHDANITPWMLAARDAGAAVKHVDIHPEDCTLNMEDLKRQITERTKIVAVTCVSNLVGTVVDVKSVCKLAHQAGAWVFLDAVHYAPHRSIDVQDWDCDFLACSPYKFFGPHLGVLWGRRKLLEELPAYKVRPASDHLPDRWMTGTQNHESLAGLTGTLDYLVELTEEAGDPITQRQHFVSSMQAVEKYESVLARRLLQGLAERSKFRVWGITDEKHLKNRVPTISITHSEKPPDVIARHLAERQIYSWSGNSYALSLTERLGLENEGGTLRLGLVHYNTEDEVDAVLAALVEL